jgi:hypothetical protein
MVIAIALAGLACKGSSPTKRTGSGAPVEVITTPTLIDGGGVAHGGTTDEVEPNDGDDTATPLPLGGTVRGKIDTDSDVDRFRLDVAQAGVLDLELSAIDGVDLILELEDSGGTVLAKSDRGGARIREGLPNFGVAPGRYTAVVRKKLEPPKPVKTAKPKKNAKPVVVPAPAGPSPVYELSAQVSALAPNAEREPDNDRGTANDLIIGDTAIGFLGWTGDVDVYKLSVEALSLNNAVDIEVSAIEGVALTLEVSDALGQPLLERKVPRGSKLVVRGLVPVVAQGGAPFNYLTLKSDRSNPETGYQLRVTAHVIAPDAELEPDDTLERAMSMPADRTIVHATWTPGDVDCFALAPSETARSIEATIDSPSEVELAAELVVDGKVVAKAEHAKGAPEHVTGTVPAGARAIVRVRGVDASATAEGAYDVTIKDSGPP